MICEIKRSSPSKGSIADLPEARCLASAYLQAGVGHISVLTEEPHFGGGLDDLVAVKQAYPGVAVLRKDFLFDEEDVEVSHRAGADAVLLIAALHDSATLARLYLRARSLGMEALVEVHSPEDVDKLRSFRPSLVGINARNLSTFGVDLLHPLALRTRIDWKPRVVFESGVGSPEDAFLVGTAGFAGLLIGEAAVRHPETVGDLLRGFVSGRCNPSRFWPTIAASRRPGRPLVKICGLSRVEDVVAADEAGADLLGFVMAASPRQVVPRFVDALPATRALKVGVVVLERGEQDLDPVVGSLLDRSRIDAVQFHGAEEPFRCADLAFPYYKALRPASAVEAAEGIAAYRCPRVLIDASSVAAGGTGQTASSEVIAAAGRAGPLWLAGGLNPDNIARIVSEYAPELVDASSGLESSPGIKDHARVRRFVEATRRVAV